MKNKGKKKAGALACAITVILIFAAYVTVLLIALIGSGVGGLAVGLIALYGGIAVIVSAGVLLALRSRLREIDGGEEEEAEIY